MLYPLRLASLLAFTSCLLLSTGCGGKKTITVKGNLVLPEGLKLEQNDSVAIAFVPEAGGPATVAPFNTGTNTFEAKGVALGQNKITVAITPYSGPDHKKKLEWLKPNVNDVFGSKSTPLSYDAKATPPEQNITINLPMKKVEQK